MQQVATAANVAVAVYTETHDGNDKDALTWT